MDAHLQEWLHLLLRWFHIVAGIMWIGDSFLFMWLDRTLRPPDPPREGVAGELYMVHGGGYYQVEKRMFRPGHMPPLLHWFKWEATLTFASGFFLLVVVYYLGGAILLVDRSVSTIPTGYAITLGLALLPLAWLVYDALWSSKLGKSTPVAGVISFVLLAILAYGLTRVFSARAAFMHVGAMLGTLMVTNVWVRILPAQRRMLAAVKRGEPVDPAPGLNAKKRSTHNTYMTLPVLFVMVSNHFPTTYGSRWNWVVLLLLSLAGAALRHFMLSRTKQNAWLLVAASLAVVTVFSITSPKSSAEDEEDESLDVAKVAAGAAAARGQAPSLKPIDPETVGTIHGAVRFEGPAPERLPLPLPGDCAASHQAASKASHEPPLTNSVLVKDGFLQNTLVFLSEGTSGYELPPPSGEVVLDQKGCVYHPRVIAARTGQPVTFVNSDPVLHNIHAVTQKNDGFNLSMVVQASRVSRTFPKPEIVKMKCDVHPWMGARIGVFAHPWFSITDERGAFTIAGVPPGDYVVTAWHEELGEKTAKATVTAKGRLEVGFALSVR